MAAVKAQRLHHSGLGAVPADADRRDGAGLVLGFPGRRSARARHGHALSADPARLPAGAPDVPGRARGDAAILPRIVAIGDVDEDEIVFAEAATGELAEVRSPCRRRRRLERRLLLAKLILQWAPRRCGAGRRVLVANTPGRRAGPGRRSRAPDGRHDHAAGAVGQARRSGAG